MRKFLGIASIVVLALLTVPSTTAGASTSNRARLFAGFGHATLVVTDPDAGTFVIDGSEKTNLGPLRFHSEGVFTGQDTFSLATTLTFIDGSTITSTADGTSTLLPNGDNRFKNHDVTTGGTGRFAGATGTTTTVGKAHNPDPSDPSVAHLSFVFAGKLTF